MSERTYEQIVARLVEKPMTKILRPVGTAMLCLKACRKCGAEKECGGFYERGLECRVCARSRITAYNVRNAEYIQARETLRRHEGRAVVPKYSEKRDKAAIAAAYRRYYVANRYKALARDKLRRAVERGALTKPLCCEMCQQTGPVDGHHDDYSRPLDVRWLCERCHYTVHRRMKTPEGFSPRKTKWRKE